MDSSQATEEGLKKMKMKASSSSPFSPFKAKKILQSSSKSSPLEEEEEPKPSDPITPQKSIHLPGRSRNRGVALSVKEVRKIAEGLRKSKNERPLDLPDPIMACTPTVQKEKQIPVKLPEKYELLVEFFNYMESSIRLLNMRGTRTSFTNISTQIESLTDRRFSYAHLAQLKYILPEAIIVKKVLLQDEQSLCMIPHLQITLENDAFKNEKVKSGFSSLRKVFRSRLVDFSKAHPEGDDVPEDILPNPFNRSKQEVAPTMSAPHNAPLSIESSSYTLPQRNSTLSSHLPSSFRPRFTQKVAIPQSEKTPLLATLPPKIPTPTVPTLHGDATTSNEETSCSVDASSKLPDIRRTSTIDSYLVKLPPSPNPSSIANISESKTKTIGDQTVTDVQGTPAKLMSTPARLMAATPDMQTPKRCRMSHDDDYIASPDKLTRRPPRNRSLFGTPVKNAKGNDEMNEAGKSSVDLDSIKLLPESLVQSIRENERRLMKEQDPDISHAKLRKRVIARLPKMFDMIRLIFQYIKRSVVSKEELIHKIIAHNCDIVDRREVEEQLALLQELIPEWILEKVSYSGDVILCINKMASVESMRRRLAEAE